MLRRMNRKYTRSRNSQKGSQLFRALSPDWAVTTDIIVGFPGESEADFEADDGVA